MTTTTQFVFVELRNAETPVYTLPMLTGSAALNSNGVGEALKLDPLVACASVFRASSPAEKPRKRRRNLQSSVQRQRGGLRLADLFSLWVFLHFPCLHLSAKKTEVLGDVCTCDSSCQIQIGLTHFPLAIRFSGT
uniref:HDC08176 n=1 Tax=Drosophila melanogaster TaxID=7227 RepID=Q6ILW7_DROME|nr:TPA_inf: HDC08176 [Drosophila melanogaster]